jgi:deoxyribodipyrimidine photo-lyase
LDDLNLLPKLDWARDFDWQPGEAGAHKLLKAFRDENYACTRDLPAVAGTSRLSPHLHFGEISPRQVWAATRHEPFRWQLIWREFAHHLLYHFPHTPEKPLRAEFEKFPWSKSGAGLKEWKQGRTGFPIVDAGMRELWATGWMHNRVRMVAASFLVKDLLIPWQGGARWFWDTLVDADLANNTFGWQWVAGCGADAAPFFRIFNPTAQAEKFDPTGAYRQRWADEPVPPIVEHAEARNRALAALKQIRQ